MFPQCLSSAEESIERIEISNTPVKSSLNLQLDSEIKIYDCRDGTRKRNKTM